MHMDSVSGTDKTVRRNTTTLIQSADDSFRAAQMAGLLNVPAYPGEGRRVELHSATDMGRKIVDFVRYSYLGLDNHPLIVAGAIGALERYGNLHWSCARTRLNFQIACELEEALSALFAARVIVYSSVLAANMGALPLLASGHLTDGEKPVVVFDKLAHATLAFHKATVALEAEVLTIEHNDVEALERVCRTRKKVAYVCDGVYSMGGAAPMRKLQDLQSRYGLFLYIDDAHGVSIFGDRGEGFARSQISGPTELLSPLRLEKGLEHPAGCYCLGPSDRKNFSVGLRSHTHFRPLPTLLPLEQQWPLFRYMGVPNWAFGNGISARNWLCLMLWRRRNIAALNLCDADRMTRHHSDCLLQRYVDHWKTFGCGFYLVFNKGVPASPPLGRCGLRMTPERDVELGYCFTRAATGRGLATEAAAAVVAHTFRRMAIDQIVAFVRPANYASMRVLAKLGFHEADPVEQARRYLRLVLNRSAFIGPDDHP